MLLTRTKSSLALASLLLLSACSTQGPRPQPVQVRKDGTVSVHAFGWNAMGVPPGKGIPYRLEKDGKTVQEGKLRAVVRVAAILLPPSILIVPTGLNPNITYNLVTGKQE